MEDNLGRQLEYLLSRGQGVQELTVLDCYALGSACRAGSVDDVSKLLRQDVNSWVLCALLRNLLGVGIEANNSRGALGQACAHGLLRNDQRSLCVGAHEREPIGRIKRV